MENKIIIYVSMDFLDGTSKTRITELNTSLSDFNDIFYNKKQNDYFQKEIKDYEIISINSENKTIHITLKEKL